MANPLKAAASVCMLTGSLLTGGAQAAIGDTTTWTFDLPATGVASQNPPYPVVATLTGTEILGGVTFTLDANELSPGFADDPLISFVERLTIVYNPGATAPADLTFSNAAGSTAPVASMTYFDSAPNGLDASYTPTHDSLAFDWCSGHPKVCSFNATETSTWSVLGTGVDLADFLFPAAGLSNSMPSPIFGVISVTAYNLDSPRPTPSNWVAGQIPEPGTYALILAGLGAIGLMSRRRRGA